MSAGIPSIACSRKQSRIPCVRMHVQLILLVDVCCLKISNHAIAQKSLRYFEIVFIRVLPLGLCYVIFHKTSRLHHDYYKCIGVIVIAIHKIVRVI